MWCHRQILQQTEQQCLFSPLSSTVICSSATLELLNYSVHKITVWPITGHHAPSSSWWLLDCMTEEFVHKARHLAGACGLCFYSLRSILFKHQLKLIDICVIFALACQWDNYSILCVYMCVCVCVDVRLEPASLCLDTIRPKYNCVMFLFCFFFVVVFLPKAVKSMRLFFGRVYTVYTHRRVWQRNCWRTPGCQHCNWGGRVSPSHSGWCYTAGQRTWRRCAPAL